MSYIDCFTEVPGKVRNIAVKAYAKQADSHEITWNRPTNIASATDNVC